MDQDDALWYFAYGSNMSLATFVERRGMRPLAIRCGWLDGYRLCFDLPIGPGERACANVARDMGARVAGVLYRITRNDADRLDGTEGVPRGIYERIDVEVRVDGTERVSAFTYQSSLRQPNRKPSARDLGLLLDGARAHGLAPEYVAWLERFDLAFDERTVQEGPMEQRTVRSYFAYNSPYAFLANTRLARELAPLGVTVESKPVYSPRSGGGPDPTSLRIKYLFEDVRRFADAYGLRLNPGPFADSRRACLGFLFAQAEGRGTAYHDGVYAARFLDGQDIGQPETLTAVAERAGLDRARFLAALDDPRWDAALTASNEDAKADGVFGFPFFLFQGQRFWGNDRIEWLARAIQAAPSI
jgi:2-hydroxychromene-2-carboxylate isomerase/cation transport regulator ChaC